MKNKIIIVAMLLVSTLIRADDYWHNIIDMDSRQSEIAYNKWLHEQEKNKPGIVRNWTSAFWQTGQNAWNSIGDTFRFLQSQEGAQFTIDSTINFATGAVLFGAYIYFILYASNYLIDFDLSQEGMQIYYPGDITITMADVAGLAGAKADMADIITYLENPEIYKNIGARVPKGVLMNGAPGNGKTMLARAVAGEVNCPFISINGSAFVEMYVGLGAQRVRNLFAKARALAYKYKACIIFIDEIDSLALQRSGGSGGDREHDQTLNALLAEMDGLDQSENPVIVLGATNRVQLLDEAVVRPGRFDRKVEVFKLDIKDRVELLELAMNKVKMEENFDVHRIARFTRGFSGAELANLINEAAIIAANQKDTVIRMRHVELAFDNITLGREITGMEQSDEKKWNTAIHEAGHAIATIMCDANHVIHKVSITPRSKFLGIMRKLPLFEMYDFKQQDLEDMIVITLCGRYAELEFFKHLSTGAGDDLQKAHTLAYEMVALYGMSDKFKNIAFNQRNVLPNDIGTQVEQEVQKIIDRCSARSEQLIAAHRNHVEAIARLLMEKGTVTGQEIYEVIGMQMPKLSEVL